MLQSRVELVDASASITPSPTVRTHDINTRCIMRRISSLLILIAFPSLACAQASRDSSLAPPVVAADAGAIRSARVATGQFVRAISFVRDGQERRVGTITERISERGSGTSAILIRAQEITMGQRTVIDTAVSNRSTLAPIWHNSKQPTATMALRFDGRHVTGSHTAGTAAPEPIDQTVDAAVFDSNNQELVMGALPLALGYAARLPMYIYESKGIVWCDLRVVGQETLDGTDAWKLDVSYAGARGSYWFAKATGVMLKSDLVLPTGATMRMALVK